MSAWRRLLSHPGHVFFILLAYVPFLGERNFLITSDQKVHLNIAIEMWEKSSWLKPLLFGEGRYLQPPFQYWATLLGWKLFGFGLWGALLPSALAVVGTAAFLTGIAGYFSQKRWEINSGLVFAATAGTAFYAVTGQTEIYLCLLYAASWWSGLRYLSRPVKERRRTWLYLAFLLAGMSALVLSPLYLVVWSGGFLLYLLISGEWELFIDRHLYLAAALGAVAGTAWFVAFAWTDPDRFWIDYSAAREHRSALSFWWTLLYFSFPFTLLLIPSFRAMWKMRRSGDILRFILCWSFPLVVFCLFAPYRFKAYLFLLFPAIALMIDWAHFRIGRSRFYWFFMTLTGLLTAGAMAGAALVYQQGAAVSRWVVLGMLLVAMLAFAAAWRDRLRGLGFCALAAILLVRWAAVQIGESEIGELRSELERRPQAAVAMLDEERSISHESGALSVALERPLLRVESLKQAGELMSVGGMLILTGDQRGLLDRFPESLRPIRVRESGHYLVVY